MDKLRQEVAELRRIVQSKDKQISDLIARINYLEDGRAGTVLSTEFVAHFRDPRKGGRKCTRGDTQSGELITSPITDDGGN